MSIVDNWIKNNYISIFKKSWSLDDLLPLLKSKKVILLNISILPSAFNQR